MRIACVHLALAGALRSLGHEVLELGAGGGVMPVLPLLGDFEPDLFIQQERLGERTLFTDLPALGCPRVFWSIDTHLNSFWQRWYGRLFDLVCTTQKHWTEWFRQRAVNRVLWLPWFGTRRALLSWEERTLPVSFVGRLTSERPVRSWFVDLLGRVGELRLEQTLNHADMLALYDRTRVVPNESIFGEINFRLFEAASCGCAVVNPDIAGLTDLFSPGEDVAVYRDGCELEALLRRFAAQPLLARVMGVRARERVQREHLPEHRAEHLLAAALQAGVTGMDARTGSKFLWLTVMRLQEAGRVNMPWQDLENALLRLPVDQDILAALLRLRAMHARDAFLQMAVPVSQKGQYAESLAVNVAGSLGALRHDAPALARLFLLRHARHEGLREEGWDTPVSICLAWARELQRRGESSRPGFVFNPKRHVPDSALECLVLASEYEPGNSDIYRRMAALTARQQGWESLRLQALSYLSLRDRANWRLGIDLGVTDCRAFRTGQGLEELLLARDQARRSGDEERFQNVLAGMDASGLLAARLDD